MHAKEELEKIFDKQLNEFNSIIKEFLTTSVTSVESINKAVKFLDTYSKTPEFEKRNQNERNSITKSAACFKDILTLMGYTDSRKNTPGIRNKSAL